MVKLVETNVLLIICAIVYLSIGLILRLGCQLWKMNTFLLYRQLPLRMASRAWGRITNIELPLRLRGPILGWYVRTFKCNMAEATEENLLKYRNLADLFNRTLKQGLRPVHRGSSLVSPVDGTVQSYGRIENGYIKQVKGITYPLDDFLSSDVVQNLELEKQKNDTDLYYVIYYLAPGDYHAFHSPVDWTPTKRYHFSGKLLSVSGYIMERISSVLCLNERVLLTGEWDYGFFSYTAVGATNDSELRTNLRGRPKFKVNEKHCLGDWKMGKGDRIGEFKLGSSVVLIFSAPRGDRFQFHCRNGDKVQYGQPLGHVHSDDIHSSSSTAENDSLSPIEIENDSSASSSSSPSSPSPSSTCKFSVPEIKIPLSKNRRCLIAQAS